MAGHSHWAGIKHKKALIDSKRGKLWSKLSKAIIIAARDGGGDPDANLRLRYAINDAKAVSMPKDNIERAIKKGTGELAGGNLESVVYEGYGPAGVAVLCEALTDNRNRTAPELRKVFEIAGGKLGATGCVAWMFDRKGLILSPREKTSEDPMMEVALESGAEDVKAVGDNYEIVCDPDVFSAVREALEKAAIEIVSAEITRIPQETIDVTGVDVPRLLKMMDALDDHDDVQTVSANFNIPENALAEIDA